MSEFRGCQGSLPARNSAKRSIDNIFLLPEVQELLPGIIESFRLEKTSKIESSHYLATLSGMGTDLGVQSSLLYPCPISLLKKPTILGRNLGCEIVPHASGVFFALFLFVFFLLVCFVLNVKLDTITLN